MIEEDYVSFETARLLKEKGFNELCSKYYILYYGGGYCLVNRGTAAHDSNCIDVPTIQMVMKWLREIYKLHITVYSCSQESWAYRITKPHQKLEDGAYAGDYASYEETCEAAIKYCLENLI
jgi:hypothetical protein